MRTPLLTVLFLTAAALGLVACGSSSSGGGGTASTAAGASAGSAPGGLAGSAGAATAPITSLRVPAVLANGDVPIAVRLADAHSRPVDLSLAFSRNGGASWQALSLTAASPAAQGLATAPAPGREHVLLWDSATDLPGFASAVVLRVESSHGGRLLSAPFAIDNLPRNPQVTLTRFPYLQSTTRTGTTIVWRTQTPTDSFVEFGTTAALGRRAGDATPTLRHEVELTGLRPGTNYTYRIVSSGLPVTRRLQLETAPDPGPEFTFLVFGDSGTGEPEQADVAAALIRETEGDFILHVGDVVYPNGGLNDPIGEFDDRFFRPYEELLHRLPFFAVPGNHDLYPTAGSPFQQAFVFPHNGPFASELYYSFEWGDAKFIGLESLAIFRVPSGPHMDWFIQELQQNQRKWLIVFFHHPLYSSGMHGDDTMLQGILGSMLEHNGVDLVLTGHEHNYERTLPIKQYNQDPAYPGLVHLISGAGGEVRPVSPGPRSAVALSALHYLKLTIRGDQLHGQAIDPAGQVLDSFVIQNQ